MECYAAIKKNEVGGGAAGVGGRGTSLLVQWLRLHLLMQGGHEFNLWSEN